MVVSSPAVPLTSPPPVDILTSTTMKTDVLVSLVSPFILSLAPPHVQTLTI